MTRKKKIVLCSLSGVVLLGFAGFYWAISYVPPFYRTEIGRENSTKSQKDDVKSFTQKAAFVMEDLKYKEDWTHEFRQSEINSWLAAEIKKKFADLVPTGAEQPRIQFQEDSLFMGFRYGFLIFKPVINLRIKPWITPEKRLAIEIEQFRVGLLPIPMDEILQRIALEFELDGGRVEWRRSEAGNDVMIVQLGASKKHRSRLSGISIAEEKIRISGQAMRRKH